MARRTSKCQRGGEATRFERLRLPSCTPALWPWPQGASFRAAAGEEHRCADTMVSIAGNRLSRWRARRRSLANGLLVGPVMGLDLVDMAWLVVRYRRAQREVSLSLERRRRIRAASFNLNAFSTQQSLSLFRFSPVRIGHLVDMLEIYVELGEARLSVTPIECISLLLRRLSSPCRWGDLEELFGRSSIALCIIFYATVEGMKLVGARWVWKGGGRGHGREQRKRTHGMGAGRCRGGLGYTGTTGPHGCVGGARVP